jgi:hypothetical protein
MKATGRPVIHGFIHLPIVGAIIAIRSHFLPSIQTGPSSIGSP